MAKLHKALEALHPLQYSDVPIDDLDNYLRNTFKEAEFVVNSVPPIPGGDDYEHAHTSKLKVNCATKASEVVSSHARGPHLDEEMEHLAKGWGKPIKLSAKENPLGVNIYKMSGHDKRGAWFARRSVHEGLGFTKWKRAMQREFPESLQVQTGPGGGSVRGIGGDRRLERHDANGTGRLEVYELSAKFPPPTSPRDFVTLLLTSENALSNASQIASDHGRGPKVIPRHWIVVSIPCKHPDAPTRDGLVRGQYESVEIIREIPLCRERAHSAADVLDQTTEKATTRARGATVGVQDHDQSADQNPECNPVEWIMVTRSDPGGGIPRFLVDRGTPPSIAGDVVKFLDWACSHDEFPADDEDVQGDGTETNESTRRPSFTSMNSRVVAGIHKDEDSDSTLPEDSTESLATEPDRLDSNPNGVLSQVTSTIGGGVQLLSEGIGRHTPDVIKQQLPGAFTREETESDSDSSSTASSSQDSFASAEPFYTAQTSDMDRDRTPVGTREGLERIVSSDLSDKSVDSASSNLLGDKSDATHSTEKELAKIDAKKKHLDDKLAATREKQERDVQKAMARSEEEAEKHRTRAERDMRKQQERHDKEMKKLERRADREAHKIEKRRKKELEKDTLARTQREKDEHKQRVDFLEEENRILREQLGELQRENTKLVVKMGRIGDHGQTALQQVRDEINQERGMRRDSSVGSTGSGGSGLPRGRALSQGNSNASSEKIVGHA